MKFLESFIEYSLGEILSLQYGKSLPERNRSNTGYPVYGSGGIVGSHSRYYVAGPGIVVGRKGSIGTVYYETQNFYPIDTVFYVAHNEKLVDLKFVYYLLIAVDLTKLNSDAAVPGLNRNIAQSRKVKIPPLPIQRKIAAILSAYDDLIENNARRIRILEEMAQNIYREWFVHFRFPGHEGVPLVDSPLGPIPLGWEVLPMASVADVIDCLHSKKPSRIYTGNNLLLQLFNIGENGKFDLNKKYLISDSDYKQWINRIEIQEGDCVITNVGRIAAVAQIPTGVKAALGRNMTGIRAKPKYLGRTYLLEYLLSPYKENEVVKKKDSGTIMDSMNVKGINIMSVLVPPKEVLDCFENKVRPIRRLIEISIEKNLNLRQQRDLLLPRLMSGELDVEGMEIPIRED